MTDLFHRVLEYRPSLATGLAGIGLAVGLLVLSQVALAAILVALPADFFNRGAAAPTSSGGHTALRWAGRIAKNLLGAVILLLGIPLILPGVPGPGLVLIVIGVSLLDFPGKRRLEQRVVGRPRVLKAINALRARFGRPPLVVDGAEERQDAGDTP